MIIWATFALLITASPVFAWRWQLRQDAKKPAAHAADRPQDPAGPPRTQPLPIPQQPSGHTPQQKPTWAATPGAHGEVGGTDQTMQIALGGLGGRKE
jgi:hypothetical protein